MKQHFGTLHDGRQATLYTIQGGGLTAKITDYGATLVSLLVPDRDGSLADVVLGFDDPNQYTQSTTYFGATIGRNANRVGGAAFTLNGRTHQLKQNENSNSLHSGPDSFHIRLWQVAEHHEDAITLQLFSPHGDQGFPGNATIQVTYRLDTQGGLHIVYNGLCDQDTVFNMTNHSYFNLAGHSATDKAMEQTLSMSARVFTPADEQSIPTGETRGVAGTPMDFRSPKAIGRDIDANYECLKLQGGFDHNWEVFCNPCAILADATSGRSMAVHTDCPGVQFYAGNYIENELGKGGVVYPKRSGICLETQHYPNSVNVPHWKQPFTKAGDNYHSETIYKFHW